MYSVVLMAALSGSATAPDWGWCLRCHGCHGCHACAGWWGGGHCGHCGCGWGLGCACWAHTGVGGCWCAGYFGGYPPIGHDFCSYCGCFACYGYPTGIGAGYGNGGFYGRGGWNGGCWCNGGSCGCWCNGCACGCCSCGASGGASGWAAPTPSVTPEPAKKDKKPQEEVRLPNRARLIVQVPEDAKVYIDGKLMKSTSAERVFGTPELRRDQVYFYDITAEVVRDGQTVSDTKRVYLRVGQVARASFGDMAPVTATVGSDE